MGIFMICLLLMRGCSVQAAHRMYPFGLSFGDAVVDVNDDGDSGEILISTTFPFFGHAHHSLYVSTNGVISFLQGVSTFTPAPFPLPEDRRYVAPFWADVDTTRNDGQVYYREALDADILQRATTDVRNTRVDMDRFQATWVFITTWDRVTFYGGSQTTPTNTFQAVLITNGRHSFAIFNYDIVRWTTGTASDGDAAGLGGTPAQVGFNAGDGRRYFSVPGSRTGSILNIDTTSNVDIPGRWFFRIEEKTIKKAGCNTQGTLTLGPRLGSMLGGKRVYISGPCFTKTHDIICKFSKFRNGKLHFSISVHGTLVDSTKAVCMIPMTWHPGRTNLAVSTNGGITESHHGTFWIVDEDEEFMIERVNIGQWLGVNSSRVISWNPDLLHSPHVNVDFVSFRSQSDGIVIPYYISLLTNTSNTGTVTLPDHVSDNPRIPFPYFGAIRVSQSQSTLPGFGESMWSDIHDSMWFQEVALSSLHIRRHLGYPVSVMTGQPLEDTTEYMSDESALTHTELLCHLIGIELEEILEKRKIDYLERAITNINGLSYPKEDIIYRDVNNFKQNTKDWMKYLYNGSCSEWSELETEFPVDFDEILIPPCTLEQALLDPDFVQDPKCNIMDGCNKQSQAYHCILSLLPSPNGHAQGACYDSLGNLLPFVLGGGTAARVHVECGTPYLSHYISDILPYHLCCGWTLEDKASYSCQTYLQFRKTFNCIGYEPPRPAFGLGDPHMITLDGVSYTFNGLGEFIILSINNGSFELQGRTKQSTAPTGTIVSATSWAAFAMKANNSDTMQIEYDDIQGVVARITGNQIDFDGMTSLYFQGVVLSRNSTSPSIKAIFTEGLSVTVQEHEQTLAFTILVAKRFKGQTVGLLGNFNDNAFDDYMSANGTILPHTADMQTIHYDFGETWRTTSEGTLFTYTEEGESYSYFQHPQFIPQFELPQVPDEVEGVCGDNKQCMYDFVMTGNPDLAFATKQATHEAELIVNATKPVIMCGFVELAHGYTNTSDLREGAVVLLSCEDGYDIDGPIITVCLPHGEWSNNQTLCKDSTQYSSSPNCYSRLFVTSLLILIITFT